jgi:SAM-dependent methyltransferase
MRTIPLTVCPVCASEESRTLDAGRENHELRECLKCGAVFAPEYADPEEVFTEGYLLGKAGKFGLDCSHPRFHSYLVRCGHRRMEVIEKATGLGAGSTICDVGCGTGELLEAAVARGWIVQGVEPLQDAAQHVDQVLGLPVIATTLEESGLPESSFDVVCAMHVLEHMPSATEFLGSLARWAKPGGFVAIESPNWGSVQRIVYHGNWMGLRPLEHLIHLTPDSLRKSFVNTGLEPVAIRTPSHLDEVHTVDEALEALGRPHWKPRLQRFSKEREVEGVQNEVPNGPAMAFLKLLEKRDDRRGKGAALMGVARRPA